ncbi:hypothetical protein M9435_001597 [Picochlorum sp. BPE23]|nr:hypothetical protein M9435_001597 [Picochlorum sp. BPE23]
MSRTCKPPVAAAAVVWCCLFILASNALLEASATFSSATSNNKIPEKSHTLSPASDEQFEQLRETALGKSNSTEMEHAQNHQQLVTEQGSLISIVYPIGGSSSSFIKSLPADTVAKIPSFKEKRNGLMKINYRRSVGVYDGVEMACGMGYMNPYITKNHIAVSKDLFAGARACGLCANVYCTDTICGQRALNANRTFMIVDECSDCDTNDIVASISGYTDLTLVDPDINPIVTAAFDLVPCGDLVTGSIKLLTSPNMSKKYLGINLSNTKVPVRGVRINGIVLQLGNDGFWSIRSNGRDNIPLQPPYVLQVLGANNELLNFNLKTLVSQDLGSNFGEHNLQ